MYILGIETTCDETAAAVVKNGTTILSHVVASQAELHRPYHGVFPEIAARSHIGTIIPVIEQALTDSKLSPRQLDRIAVSNQPGLMGSLLVGVTTATALSIGWQTPLIGVNHVEAHLYSAMMGESALDNLPFPALGVLLSGGHTFLTQMRSPTDHQILSTTVDDAMGETFDKVARQLGLPYPGGVHVETLARKGDPARYRLKAGQVKRNPLAFSFSGLKTAVLYALQNREGAPHQTRSPRRDYSDQERADLAASFQQALFSDLICKIGRALALFPPHARCRALYLGGGVTANERLRSHLAHHLDLPLYFPPQGLCTDNGAMIAGLAFHLDPLPSPAHLRAFPRLRAAGCPNKYQA